MIKIKEQYKILPNDLPKFEIYKTLEYYDGPLLMAGKSEKEGTYLISWCDSNSKYNRWLIWYLSAHDYDDYIELKSCFRQTIQNAQNGEVYILDKNIEQKICAVFRITLDDIPVEYLPEKGCMYDENIQ